MFRALTNVLWTDDRKIRIRLQHWTLTLAIYIGAAIVLDVFVDSGRVAAWLACALAGMAAFHVAMRNDWTKHFADPSLGEPQIVFGIVMDMAAYAMGGEPRSAALFPLVLMLAVGAFAVPWRRMVQLTAFMLIVLGGTMLGMHFWQPGRYSTTVDAANFLVCGIVLPATSIIAVALSNLRERLHQQRAELRTALARIQTLATLDELTGLANRRHAQHMLDMEVQRVARGGAVFAVALIDLDHFKSVNDLHGHAAGDAVLRHFAQVAGHGAREVDLIARWGGEEFLLLMPNTSEAAALAATDRLRRQLEQAHVIHHGTTLRATCSAGVAEHCGSQALAQTLLRCDRALYRAKESGRNRVMLASRECGLEDTRVAAAGAAGPPPGSDPGPDHSATIEYEAR